MSSISDLPPPSAEFLAGAVPSGGAPSGISDLPPPPKSASPDSPAPEDVFGDARSRMASGFGNDGGIAKFLASKGVVNAQRNKNGDLVFQKNDGTWVKDQDNFFKPDSGLSGYLPDHPINWAESHMGRSLPVLGMGAGGVAGAGAGPLGAVAGAGAGSAAGEGLRQAAGRALGTYDGGAAESAGDMGLEGLNGMTAEMGGQAVNKLAGPYIKAGLDSAGNAIKNGVSRTSEFLTGVPKEAVQRLIERPTQVMGADAEGNALSVAQNAQKELLDRNSSEREAISNARRTFRDQFGNEVVNTSPILRDSSTYLASKAPVDGQTGALSGDEIDELGRIASNRLTTPQQIQPEVNFTPLQETKLKYGAPDTQPVPHGAAARDPYGPAPTADVMPVSTELKFGKNGSGVTQPEVMATLPQKSAAALQNLADSLDREITTFDQSKLPGTGDTPYQSRLRQLRGQVKGALHELDPSGLGAADSRFSNYADNASRLGRLDNDDQMEGFINNFYGKNKSLMRESAQKLIPDSMDDIADIGASRAFTKQGPAGSEMGRRMALGTGAGLMGMAAGVANHSPAEAILGGLATVATSPGINKAVIGRGSQALQSLGDSALMKMFAKNPELIQTIANPELRSVLNKMFGTGSALVPSYVDQPDNTERNPTGQ